MWKPAAVVGLWLSMLVIPHFGSRQVQVTGVTTAGLPIAANVPADDLGDPPLEGPPAGGGPGATADAGPPPGAAAGLATIHFKNALGDSLILVSAKLSMDGAPLAPVTDLRQQGDNVVFTGHLAPGPHVVSTRLTCQGASRGPFTYVQGYRWDVRSEQTLTVLDNRAIVFTISAVRHRGINVPLNNLVDVSVYNELLPQPLED